MRWTSEQEETAIAMRKAGHTYRAIGKALVPPRGEESVRLFFVRRHARLLKPQPYRVEIYRVKNMEPSLQALADRDRRINAPLTLDMAINGTPRPGQSALDRMRASEDPRG
jgi:hypothetical protein